MKFIMDLAVMFGTQVTRAPEEQSASTKVVEVPDH